MIFLALVWPMIPLQSGVLCPLRAVTGIPCPMCGMTTSVIATTHFDFGGAFAANPAGLIAVATACFLLVRRPQRLRVSLPVISVALIAMWIFELNRYGIV